MNGVQDFPLRHCLFKAPGIGVPDIHVLNETHFKAVVPGEADKVQDFVVIDPPNDHGIDLDRRHARPLGGKESLQDVIQISPFRQVAKAIRFKRIDTYVDSSKARRRKATGLFCQQRSVCG